MSSTVLLPSINHYISSNVKSYFFLGGGLSFALERKKYIEIPIVLLLPTAYCGYHIYKNRSSILQYIK